MKRLRASVAALLLCTCACSSATIYRRDAPDLEATLVGGNTKHLYVETEDGRVVQLERSKITDIDHPGNVAAVVGGILTAEGGALVALDWYGPERPTGIFTVMGALIAVPGLILLAHGLIEWSRSTGAENERTLELPVRRPDGTAILGTLTVPLAAGATLLQAQ